MSSSKRRFVPLIAMLACAALFVGACSSSSSKSSGGSSSSDAASSGSTSSADASLKSLSATLQGSGSSFQNAYNQAVITDFKKVAPGVTINYAKSGSGAGKADLAKGSVDFAGTDSTIKASDGTFTGGTVYYFPTVAAPITVSYNLKGVSKRLQFSGETLVKIMLHQINTWNDQAIAADNPGVTLPSTKITTVHRSDKSGTTSNFTKYLAAVGGAAWTPGSSDSIVWPGDPSVSVGAEKNTGVATIIKSTDGAIGYVDLSDAVTADLTFGNVKNSSGKYIAPDTEGLSSTAAALASATLKPDLTYDPINAPGAQAYPIVAPTWIIAYQKQTDANKGKALQAWLHYIITTGQTTAPTVGYAPLPSAWIPKIQAQLDQMQIG